jgi:hypothetical protein
MVSSQQQEQTTAQDGGHNRRETAKAWAHHAEIHDRDDDQCGANVYENTYSYC